MKTISLCEAIAKPGRPPPRQTAIRYIAMIWELCVRYANGRETVLDVFQSQAIAQNRVDKLYAEGYPMHLAYFVRAKRAT